MGGSALSVSPEFFVSAAEKHIKRLQAGAGSETDIAQTRELIYGATHFEPIFTGDDPQILFQPLDRISLFHMSQLNWIHIAISNLLRAYGSLLDSRIDLPSFKILIGDFKELAGTVGLMDITVPDFETLRFREANLFTQVGNGDDYVDFEEAVYLVTFLNSSGVLVERTQKTIQAKCPSIGPDHMRGQFYDLSCFRRAYFSDADNLWDHFPALLKFYKGLDSKKQAEFQTSVEMAARPFGFSEKPINTSDIQGFSTIPHYVESLLARMDINRDEIIDLEEARKILPVFSSFLAELGDVDPSDTGMIEAIFTYTIKYSHPPRKTPGGVAHFLWWRATKAFWSLKADRAAIYATIGALNDPKTAEKEPADAQYPREHLSP